MLCRMATTASSFATSGFRSGATGQAQSIAAGAQADVRGTLQAVYFRDEHGFAFFSVAAGRLALPRAWVSAAHDHASRRRAHRRDLDPSMPGTAGRSRFGPLS